MDDGRHAVPMGPDKKMSREQKAGLFFVIVCGFGTLLLGGQFIWANMAKPFTVSYTGPRLITGEEQETAQMAEQKRSDTDSDQVSDYDELYIYHSSPYLADSDSDGLKDGDEIEAGGDPNCATGDRCDSLVENSNGVIPNNASGTFAEDSAAALQDSVKIQQALATLQNLSTEEVRAILLEAGANEEQLSALSDDEVRELYNQLLMDLASSGTLEDLANHVTSDSTPTE